MRGGALLKSEICGGWETANDFALLFVKLLPGAQAALAAARAKLPVLKIVRHLRIRLDAG